MVHMERDTGPTGPIAVMAGRGFGKTKMSGPTQTQAVMEELYAAKKAADKARLDRKRDRQQVELHRRRYEFVTGARTGGVTAPVACPHLLARHFDVAHPRYGDRFPITRTVLRPVRAKHQCVAGVAA